jgi:5-methylcytosine-specific restriction endonuclease McrA
MPFFLIPDEWDDDPVWDAMAGDNAVLRDQLQAGWVRLGVAASHARTDGYLTVQQARRKCTKRVLDILCAPVLGREPRLHQQGDKCACLDEVWVSGYGYRLHRFLRRNPSRVEVERQRERRADLADPAIRHRVRVRDGSCCRYCGSGPLTTKAVRAKDRRKVLTFDHVDPDRAAGDDLSNLVCCCARCNERKGRRTPEEADMLLLPVPTPEQATKLAARDQVLCDQPINAGSTPGSTPDHRLSVDPPVDPPVDGHRPVVGNNLADQPADQHSDQRPAPGAEPSGLGWAGQPDRDAPGVTGLPARTPADPDIYTRRSRRAGTPKKQGRVLDNGDYPTHGGTE